MADMSREGTYWWDEPKTITLNNGETLRVESIKAGLLKVLTQETRKLGHQMTYSEAEEIPGMAHPNEYAFPFGSFGDIAKSVWRQISRSDQKVYIRAEQKAEEWPTKEDNMDIMVKDEKVDVAAKKKGSRYTDEDIISNLQDFYNRKGRLPNQDDIRSGDFSPSWQVIVKRLGNKAEWMKYITGHNQETKPEPFIEDVREATEEAVQEKPTEISVNDTVEVSKEKLSLPDGQGKEPNKIKGLELKVILTDRDPILINITL